MVGMPLHVLPHHWTVGWMLVSENGRLTDCHAAQSSPPMKGVAYKQQQWDRAKEQFEAAVKVAPSLAEAHYNLGMVLYRQGKDAEAKPHFLKAAALAPENDVIQSAPPFSKVEAPSRPSGPSGMSDGHGGHSH
jgi:tetratricopeptide (TPR) repeat protein